MLERLLRSVFRASSFLVRWSSPVLVLLAGGLIGLVCQSFFLTILPSLFLPLGGILDSLGLLLVGSISSYLAYCVVYFYFKVVTTPPGYPSHALSPQHSSWPVCRKCHGSKPERCHHCLDSRDHQVLTDLGFLGLEEFVRESERLLVASYDPETREIVYERCLEVVVNRERGQRFVRFEEEVVEGGGGASLVVTEDHDVFCRIGMREGTFLKVKAGTLCGVQCQMLCAATGGVRVGVEPSGREGAALRPSWLWLAKEGSRDKLRHLVERSGTDAGIVRTPTVQTREEVLQLCLHAGFAANFTSDLDDRCWEVNFSEDPSVSFPTLRGSPDVVDGREAGTVSWCVSVPSGHIFVRRVLERSPSGEVLSATRPLITGNCSVCDRCVLKMDHHCPWVANCIGFHNQRYFILFMAYLVLGSGLFALFSLPTLFGSNELDRSLLAYLSMSFCAILCLAMFVSVGALLSWHLYLVSTNQTSIEFSDNVYERAQLAKSSLEAARRWKNPYDRGVLENWRQVLGTPPGRSVLWSLLPHCSVKMASGMDWTDVSDDAV